MSDTPQAPSLPQEAGAMPMGPLPFRRPGRSGAACPGPDPGESRDLAKPNHGGQAPAWGAGATGEERTALCPKQQQNMRYPHAEHESR